MRKLLSLLTALLFVGTVWATPVTGTLDMGTAELESPVVNNGVTFSWTSSYIITGGEKSSGFKGKEGKADMIITIPSGATLTGISKINGNNWGSTNVNVYTGTSSSGTLVAEISQGTNSYTINANNTGSSYYLVTSASKNAWITSLSITYEPAPAGPALSLSPSNLNLNATSVANQSITLSPSNFSSSINSVTTGLYSDAECNTAITSGAWIKNITPNGANTAVTFDVDDNDGAQRQCWLKINVSDGSSNASAILSITQAKYVAPTGTFELYSGSVKEGDYVIYYNGYAMDTTISSSRWQYKSVTPSDNKLTNPDESIIWHIAKSGDYWTLYNEAAEKYAGGTTTKNQGAMLGEVTDYAKWTVTGSSTYQFENYGRATGSSDTGNKWLRNNGASGFACYSSSTGGALTLYRKLVFSEVTISAPEHTNITVKNSSNESVVNLSTIAEGARLYVSAAPKVANAYRVAAKVYKTGDETTEVEIDENDSITMPAYPITISADETQLFAVNVAVAVAGEEGAQGNAATIDAGTATVYKANGETVALVATPTDGYDFVKWTTSDAAIVIAASDSTTKSITATIGASGTITANFKEQDCSPLSAPNRNELGDIAVTYNSAIVNWNAVDNAAQGYEVYVYNDSEKSSIKASGSVPSGTTSFKVNNLTANTKYYYTVAARGDGSTYCADGNPLLEGNFTTNDYPAAIVTLSENGVERTLSGDHKLNDVVALPSSAVTGMTGKVFKGWSTVAIANALDDAPASDYYAAGADYTIASTADKLYAVYATQGYDTIKSQTLQYDTWTYGGSTSNKSGYRLFHNGGYVESAAFDLSTLAKVVVYGGTFGGGSNNSLTIGDGTNTWKNVTVSGTSETKAHTYTDGTALTGTHALRVTSTCGSSSGTGTGVRISKVEIFTASIVFSAYTTNSYAVTFNATPNDGTLVVKYGNDAITSGDKFASGTVLTVVATATTSGYALATLTANEEDIKASKKFTIGSEDVEVVATFQDATALEDVETSVKAIKVLRNGILLIEKNGHTYNAMGQLVK